MAVILLGEKQAGTGEAFSPSVELAAASLYECLKSGTLETILFFSRAASASVTSVRVGVFADSAGKPGALLAEGVFTGALVKEVWNSATLSSGLKLTKGTKYWLALTPIGASGKWAEVGIAGTVPVWKASNKTKSFAEAETWATETKEGALWIYGEGTEEEGAPISLSGTIAVKLGSSASVTDRVGLGGTVALNIGSSGLLGDKLGLGGSIAVRFGAAGTLTTKSGAAVNLAGTISVVTAAQAKAGAKLGLGGVVKVTTATQGKVGLRQGLGGVIHLTTANQATPRMRMSLGGVVRVVVGGSGTVTVPSGSRKNLVVYTTVALGPTIPLTVQLPQQIPHTTLIE